MLNIILFMVAYLLMLIIGTLTVAGWFFITRGSTEILPNNNLLRKGKIFKGWFFFWMQEKHERSRIYYTGAQLRILVNEFKSQLRDKYNECAVTVHDASIDLRDMDPNNRKNMLAKLEAELQIKFSFKGYTDEGKTIASFSIYKEFIQYRFPEWVRHPLAQCATCFSSIYGSLFYWIVIHFLGEDLYSWARLPILAMLFFWVVFCLSLSVSITAVAKKYN
jgi:hypothetical protein